MLCALQGAYPGQGAPQQKQGGRGCLEACLACAVRQLHTPLLQMRCELIECKERAPNKWRCTHLQMVKTI